jgi:hypothetical protein
MFAVAVLFALTSVFVVDAEADCVKSGMISEACCADGRTMRKVVWRLESFFLHVAPNKSFFSSAEHLALSQPKCVRDRRHL